MSTEAGSVMDPHGKKRAKNVNKVTRGEEAGRPSDHPIVSKPPPPPSTDFPKDKKVDQEDGDGKGDAHGQIFTNKLRNCCIRYYEFFRCTKENGGNEGKCAKFSEAYQSLSCPTEWVKKWDEERKLGIFPQPL